MPRPVSRAPVPDRRPYCADGKISVKRSRQIAAIRHAPDFELPACPELDPSHSRPLAMHGELSSAPLWGAEDRSSSAIARPPASRSPYGERLAPYGCASWLINGLKERLPRGLSRAGGVREPIPIASFWRA